MMLGLTTAIGTAAAIYIGVRHVQSGVLTLGSLLLLMGYLAQLYEPLRTISRRIASMQSHLASAERAFAILDSAPDVPERANALPLGRAAGAVRFERVSFGYNAYRVLEDISFEVPAGCRVGIAGPDRGRQDHPGEPAAALLRPGPGTHPARRARARGVSTSGPA